MSFLRCTRTDLKCFFSVNGVTTVENAGVVLDQLDGGHRLRRDSNRDHLVVQEEAGVDQAGLEIGVGVDVDVNVVFVVDNEPSLASVNLHRLFLPPFASGVRVTLVPGHDNDGSGLGLSLQQLLPVVWLIGVGCRGQERCRGR